ncbi:MAG: LamG-like jellyroll fold domain-containing protein [Verrucomicrobiota bacterium]
MLSAQTLLHRYSFVSDASDSVGGANGVIIAPNGGTAATIADGLTLPGGGGGGFSGYVALPGGILTSTTNLTVEVWATQASQNQWGTIWDFGNNGNVNFELCPYPNRNGFDMIAAFTPNGGENDLDTPTSFPVGTEEYVSLTYNNSTLVGNLYYNGVLDGSVNLPNTSYCPGTIGGATGTTENWLGNDVYGDPQFQGTVYELRIWNGVVSQRYLAASALLGPSVLVTNLTPSSPVLTAGPSVVVSGTEFATLTVQLPQTGANNLLATSDATNWVSSNTNVLQVNSSGVITGVSPGSATVTATIGGVSATSGSITVTPLALIHRYSFVSDASDSVGGPQWDGTIVAPTTGSPATIANGLSLPGNTVGGNGYSGYVSLPAGILTNTTSVTIETWATQNQGNTWAELWDFGINSQAYNFALIPDPANNNGNVEVANFDSDNNDYISSGSPFPSGSEQYIAVTYNNYSLVGSIYTNGVLNATENYPNTSYAPGTYGGAGGTVNNYLGNDIYGDQQFDGTIYEFRIWNGAVSPVYLAVSAVAGPTVIVTNTTPQGALTVSVGSTTLLGSQTEQATVSGNFIQANDVTLTTAVGTWSSSNPNVLTVNSSGLITAVSGGTATVTATVNGVSGTSTTITVQSTAPTVPQPPVNTTGAVNGSASFSVGALGGDLSYQWSFDGTPIAGATNDLLTLNNLTFNNGGTYSVLITNSIGSTNLSATLTVAPAVLLHRYSFVSDASDSVGGTNWNGKIVAPNGGSPATIADGLSLPGNAAGGNGVSGYVALPNGILTNTASITVDCWLSQNQYNEWAEAWDFGNNGNQNFALIPDPASGRNNGEMVAAFTPNGGENDLDTPTVFPDGQELYVSLTFNSTTLVGNLYTNGILNGTITLPNSTYIPGTIGGAGGTTENWLGNDVYGDPQFAGTIYELRIWNGVVPPLYLALSAIAGPGIVVTNFTPTSVDVTVTNDSMIAGSTQQAMATGDFVNGSGVPITGAITNWSSSDTSVLTVNGSGLITAVNTGSATISGTVNGVTGTTATITVPNSSPIVTEQPEGSESLLAGATLSANVSVIGNPPFVYRWYNGSTLVSTTTNSSALSVPDLLVASAGSYTVVVSNAYGTATSSPVNLTVVVPSVYEQVVQKLGPLAYWPLGETNGSTAYDVIGGHNGSYTNNFTLGVAGPTQTFFGATSYSAGFDGTTAYVDIPEGPFNITNAITSLAWVQQAGLNGFDGLIGHGDPSWRISVNGTGNPGGNDGTSASADATDATSINDGNWHLVAYTYTGEPGIENNGTLYVDGSPVANNTILTAPTGDDLDVWIGGAPDYGTARLIFANIAHAAVFTQALTAAQVQGLYNGTYVAPPNSTISISRSGSSIVLTWQTGTLLSAPSVNGPWTTVSAAASPYTVPVGAGNQFYRVLVSP